MRLWYAEHMGTQAQLTRVLKGCLRIEADKQQSEVNSVQRLMQQMNEVLPRLNERIARIERTKASRFNIFQALRIERRETVLHTPFLAFILDPSETHAQGTLFLKKFFETLSRNGKFKAPYTVDAHDWQVSSEIHIGRFGIIDLVVKCPSQKYAFVIENKVEASERDRQIGDYSKWMDRNLHDYEIRQIALLTPDGRMPTSNEGRHCLTISYDKDIADFLKSALRDVKAPVVRYVIAQYIKTIERITYAE